MLKINNNLKEEEFESSDDEMNSSFRKNQLYSLKLDNQNNRFSYPIQTQVFEKYQLLLIKKQLGEEEKNLEGLIRESEELKKLLKNPEENKEAIQDKISTLKIYRDIFGLGQGGLMNLQGIKGGK